MLFVHVNLDILKQEMLAFKMLSLLFVLHLKHSLMQVLLPAQLAQLLLTTLDENLYVRNKILVLLIKIRMIQLNYVVVNQHSLLNLMTELALLLAEIKNMFMPLLDYVLLAIT